jgi:antitoxin ParD1/3/4
MNISLTPELEKGIKVKIATGHYNNASEVVREALRIAFRQDRENDWLIREAAIGYAQLEAGQTIAIESKEAFLAAIRSES